MIVPALGRRTEGIATLKLNQKTAGGPIELPAGKKELITYDEDLPEFGIRIRQGGSRNWVVHVKALDWRHLGPHAVSVFDPALDGPMPSYLKNYASGPDWHLSVQLRRVLQQELEQEQYMDAAIAPHRGFTGCGWAYPTCNYG
jgi:hypothetical protein